MYASVTIWRITLVFDSLSSLKEKFLEVMKETKSRYSSSWLHYQFLSMKSLYFLFYFKTCFNSISVGSLASRPPEAFYYDPFLPYTVYSVYYTPINLLPKVIAFWPTRARSWNKRQNRARTQNNYKLNHAHQSHRCPFVQRKIHSILFLSFQKLSRRTMLNESQTL